MKLMMQLGSKFTMKGAKTEKSTKKVISEKIKNLIESEDENSYKVLTVTIVCSSMMSDLNIWSTLQDSLMEVLSSYKKSKKD